MSEKMKNANVTENTVENENEELKTVLEGTVTGNVEQVTAAKPAEVPQAEKPHPVKAFFSGLWDGAKRIGSAVNEFAHEHPWITSGVVLGVGLGVESIREKLTEADEEPEEKQPAIYYIMPATKPNEDDDDEKEDEDDLDDIDDDEDEEDEDEEETDEEPDEGDDEDDIEVE